MNKAILFTFALLSILIISCDKNTTSPQSDGPHSEHQKDAQPVSKTKSYYTCSMHPQIHQDKPGKCPICHMTLTKVEVEEENGEMPSSETTNQAPKKETWQCRDYPDVTSEKEDICPIDGTAMIKKISETSKSDVGQIIAKVKLQKSQLTHFQPDVFPATTMMMNKKIRLLGSILQSEEKESNIPARVAGRVEKVYIKSTGSFIKINDPVIDLYSPKLITAGEEYLIAKNSYLNGKNQEFKEMLKQSEERLKLWGIKHFQYEAWFKNKKVPKTITIYSPATGIVRKRDAVVGKYFKEGQNFFELSDLSDVWVEMDVYEHDAALVKIGQKVQMEFSSLPGEIQESEIDFIAPVLNTVSRTLKIRTTVLNTSGKLKPGMAADATLNINLEGHPLVIPRTAIIDTGKRKVVWIQVSDKVYQAKTIQTGQESEGYVEIKDGIMEGEKVVIEGNFLLDAQAQLFGGYEDLKQQKDSVHNH